MPSKVIYLLYRAALLAGSPLLLLYVFYRSAKTRGYLASVGERFGFLLPSFQQTTPGSAWLHAVSVGEVVSAAGLIAALKRELPGVKVLVSVSTLAGAEIARKRLAGMADGVFFAPFDYVWIVRRVLRRLRPALVAVMETEIWPNLWREAKRSGAALVVLNGRISDKAFPKYERHRWFFEPVLAHADRILAQTAVSRHRYIALGAPADRVALGGNLKYDFDPESAPLPAALAAYLEAVKPELVWVAASTMPPAHEGDVDEDEVAVSAIQQLTAEFPRLLTILVPRRPERFESAAALLDRCGIPHVRRSRLQGAPAAPVLLLDSMGELAGVFRAADVVFMGGTLAQRGGHNILEPAVFSKAIVCGPHMENFPEIAEDFLAAGAYRRVDDAGALAGAIRQLLADPAARRALGERAREQALRKCGATAIAVQVCGEAVENATPVPLRSLLGRALFAPFTALWRAGSRFQRQRQTTAAQSLPAPVISIGGIAAGGVGKTPFAIYVASLLPRPAFLTRGYRRESPERCTIAEPGATLPPLATGDEAQLLIRSGLGPVGICANRHHAGREVAARFQPKVFVLDDGFQHWRLRRDLDIVLIDALDPWAGNDVIPAGRLREPVESLARANAFVITRTEAGRRYPAIEARLRRHNPNVPIFHSRLVTAGWTADPAGPGVAFCGLGNPASFWRTLEQLGLRPLARIPFPDHHRYRGVDLRRLASEARTYGATELWTTEKDLMNLPADPSAVAGLPPIRALRVAAQLVDQQRFHSWLLERLKQIDPNLFSA